MSTILPEDEDLPEEQIPEEERPDNAADPVEFRERVERNRRAQDRGTEFWKSVLGSVAGRQEMWTLLQSCHTFEERFACGPTGFPQPEATWFEAGQQAFGQRLYLSWLKIDRTSIALMHDEHDPNFAKPKRPRRARTE